MLTRKEFEDSLDQALEFWGNKTADEIVELIGPEVALMYKFNQRNHHHDLDLFSHTLKAVDNLSTMDDNLLKVATFFHDIGKPKVAREKDDRIVFYGHAKLSSRIAKKILHELGYNNNEIVLINFYIEHHDDFISFVLPETVEKFKKIHLIEINEKNLQRYITKLYNKHKVMFTTLNFRDVLIDLIKLCQADVKAQAEFVYSNGILVDSISNKLKKMDAILLLINKIIR